MQVLRFITILVLLCVTLGAISTVCHILQCARFDKPYIPAYLSELNKIVTFIITAQHTLFDTQFPPEIMVDVLVICVEVRGHL